MAKINNQAGSTGSGLISKDMHKWVIGGVAVIVGAGVIYASSSWKDPKEAKYLKDQERELQDARDTKPNVESLRQMLEHQELAIEREKLAEERRLAANAKAEEEARLRMLEEQKRNQTRASIEEREERRNEEDDLDAKLREKQAQLQEMALSSPIIANQVSTAVRNATSPLSKSQQMLAEQQGNTDQILRDLALLSQTEEKEMAQGGQDESWLDRVGKSSVLGADEKVKFSKTPKAPTVFQGTLIPAVLETKIVSDLPGDIRAKVLMDVYDSVNQSTIIIPKGSTLIGKYNNQVRQGQDRVMFAFNRLITPSGQSANLGGMSGSDQIGSAGLKDEVDTHFWEMFWSSLLIAGISVVAENEAHNSKPAYSDIYAAGAGYDMAAAGRTAAGQVLIDTSKHALKRYDGIAPTITINPGMRFNIFVNKDMQL